MFMKVSDKRSIVIPKVEATEISRIHLASGYEALCKILNVCLLGLVKSASVCRVQKRSTDTDTSVLCGGCVRNREFETMPLRIVTNWIR